MSQDLKKHHKLWHQTVDRLNSSSDTDLLTLASEYHDLVNGFLVLEKQGSWSGSRLWAKLFGLRGSVGRTNILGMLRAASNIQGQLYELENALVSRSEISPVLVFNIARQLGLENLLDYFQNFRDDIRDFRALPEGSSQDDASPQDAETDSESLPSPAPSAAPQGAKVPETSGGTSSEESTPSINLDTEKYFGKQIIEALIDQKKLTEPSLTNALSLVDKFKPINPSSKDYENYHNLVKILQSFGEGNSLQEIHQNLGLQKQAHNALTRYLKKKILDLKPWKTNIDERKLMILANMPRAKDQIQEIMNILENKNSTIELVCDKIKNFFETIKIIFGQILTLAELNNSNYRLDLMESNKQGTKYQEIKAGEKANFKKLYERVSNVKFLACK